MYFPSKWCFACYLRESDGGAILTAHQPASIRSIRGGWGVRKCMKSFMSLVHGLWRQDASFHWLWRSLLCEVEAWEYGWRGAWEYDLPPLSLYTQLQVVLLRRTHLAITKASCPTYVVYDVRTRVFIGCGALCYFLGFFRMPSLFIYLNWFIITFIIQLTYIFTNIKYFSPFLYNDNIKRKK